jgi:four helix bundle protein
MESGKCVLRNKSFEFAVRIVKLYKYLSEEKKEYVISKQLLRSGTSVGANIREAYNGESKNDFIHKLGIAQKECDESLYWLELLEATAIISKSQYESLQQDGIALLKMIKSSILTSKQNKEIKKS